MEEYIFVTEVLVQELFLAAYRWRARARGGSRWGQADRGGSAVAAEEPDVKQWDQEDHKLEQCNRRSCGGSESTAAAAGWRHRFGLTGNHCSTALGDYTAMSFLALKVLSRALAPRAISESWGRIDGWLGE